MIFLTIQYFNYNSNIMNHLSKVVKKSHSSLPTQFKHSVSTKLLDILRNIC